jgi:hypothetical protein
VVCTRRGRRRSKEDDGLSYLFQALEAFDRSIRARRQPRRQAGIRLEYSNRPWLLALISLNALSKLDLC